MSLMSIATNWIYAHEELAAGLLSFFVLIAALTIAIRTLKAMRHDRATSLALSIRQDYDSGVVWEGRVLTRKLLTEFESKGIIDEQTSFLKAIEDCKKNSTEDFMRLISIPALFDLMGWLVRRGCCRASEVDEQFDWQRHYNLWEPYIRQVQQKTEKQPLDDKSNAYYGNFVWLAQQLSIKVKADHTPSSCL